MTKFSRLSYKAFLLISAVGLLSTLTANWITTGIDTITDTRARKWISMQSLGIDLTGRLHAVWVEKLGNSPNYLLYSFKSPGARWSSPETIAETVSVKCALAVEKNSGSVHIAYIKQFGDSNDLCYTTNANGGWQTVRITKDTVPNFTPAIALENDSIPHVAWVTRLPGVAFKIGYSTSRTGRWENQLLVGSELGDFGSGATPYLAISPAGCAHITYRGGNYPDYHIHHAENTAPGDTHWFYEILTTSNNYDYISALAAGANEELFLACSGNDGWGMPFRTHYLHRPAGSSVWDFAQLITGPFSAQLEGFFFDGRTIHITWQLINGNIAMEQIYHCSNYSGNWINSPVRADTHTSGGSIVLDNNHCGHVLVKIETPADTELYCIHSSPLTGISEQEASFLPVRNSSTAFISNRTEYRLPFKWTGNVEVYSNAGIRLVNLVAENGNIQFVTGSKTGYGLRSGVYFLKKGNQLIRLIFVK